MLFFIANTQKKKKKTLQNIENEEVRINADNLCGLRNVPRTSYCLNSVSPANSQVGLNDKLLSGRGQIQTLTTLFRSPRRPTSRREEHGPRPDPTPAAPQPGAPPGRRAQAATLGERARTPRRGPAGGDGHVTARAFLFGSPRHTSCVHVWAFTSRRQGRGLPKWQWPGESEARSQRRRSYISGGAVGWGSPTALWRSEEPPPEAGAGRPGRRGSLTPFPEVNAQSQEPGCLGVRTVGRPDRPPPRKPRAPKPSGRGLGRPAASAAAAAPCSTLASFPAPTRSSSPPKAVARNPALNCLGCRPGKLPRPQATPEVRSAARGTQTAARPRAHDAWKWPGLGRWNCGDGGYGRREGS